MLLIKLLLLHLVGCLYYCMSRTVTQITKVFICSLLNDAALSEDFIALNVWALNMIGCGRKMSWPKLRSLHYSGTCLEDLRKTKRIGSVPAEIRSRHLTSARCKS